MLCLLLPHMTIACLFRVLLHNMGAFVSPGLVSLCVIIAHENVPLGLSVGYFVSKSCEPHFLRVLSPERRVYLAQSIWDKQYGPRSGDQLDALSPRGCLDSTGSQFVEYELW